MDSLQAKHSLKRDTKWRGAIRRSVSSSSIPVVLIHGFRGTKQGLALINKELLQNNPNYALYTPDLPGFGKGKTLHHYTLTAYVTWLRTYIRTVQRRHPNTPITLIGHSFGSIICAAYARQYTDTIKSLILINPIGTPALEGPRKTLTKLAILYYKIGAALPEKSAHRWLASPLIVRVMSITMAKTKDKELLKFIHSQHDIYFSKFHSPVAVLEAFETSVSHNVGEFAQSIPVKTLLIAGALDDITPLSAQYALVKKFPKAKLKVIDSVGHLTHYEAPKEVARYIQAFIKSV